MPGMGIEIRAQHEHEWDAVVALIDDAFAPAKAPGRLAERIRQSDAWIPDLSLVAADSQTGGLVGQVLFSTITMRTPGSPVDVLTLTPLAVAAAYRGRGVARRLVEDGLAVCARRREPLVVLEGDPRMYARLGFRPATQIGVDRPSDRIPEPAFQVVTLPAYRPGLRGQVEYPAYFYEVGAVGP